MRRLSLFLILGGAAMTVLALIWFVAAYADALEMASDFVGDDYAARLMACLYSSAPLCQGAGMLSDAPTYSPEVFWIGVVALLAGMAVRFAAGRGAAVGNRAAAHERANAVDGSASAGRAERVPDNGEIMGFIPPAQYARYSYILALSGAAAGLLLVPLAILALAGFGLALLGLTVFRPRMNALDVPHLGVICLIFGAGALLLFLSSGTFLFLIVALAQIAALYVAFNSYRHGRVVTIQNLKQECLMALRPGKQPLADHKQH